MPDQFGDSGQDVSIEDEFNDVFEQALSRPEYPGSDGNRISSSIYDNVDEQTKSLLFGKSNLEIALMDYDIRTEVKAAAAAFQPSEQATQAQAKALRWIVTIGDAMLRLISTKRFLDTVIYRVQQFSEAIHSDPEVRKCFLRILAGVALPEFTEEFGKLHQKPDRTALKSLFERVGKDQEWSKGPTSVIYAWLAESDTLQQGLYCGSGSDAYSRYLDYLLDFRRKANYTEPFMKQLQYRFTKMPVVAPLPMLLANCDKLDKWPVVHAFVLRLFEALGQILLHSVDPVRVSNKNSVDQWVQQRIDFLREVTALLPADTPVMPRLEPCNRQLALSEQLHIDWSHDEKEILRREFQKAVNNGITSAIAYRTIQQKLFEECRTKRQDDKIAKGLRSLGLHFSNNYRSVMPANQTPKQVVTERKTEIDAILDAQIRANADISSVSRAIQFGLNLREPLSQELLSRLIQARRHEVDLPGLRKSSDFWTLEEANIVLQVLKSPTSKSGLTKTKLCERVVAAGVDRAYYRIATFAFGHYDENLPSLTGSAKHRAAIARVEKHVKTGRGNAEGLIVPKMGAKRIVGPAELAIINKIAAGAIAEAVRCSHDLGEPFEPVMLNNDAIADQILELLEERFPDGYQYGENLTKAQVKISLWQSSYEPKAKGSDNASISRHDSIQGRFVAAAQHELARRLRAALDDGSVKPDGATDFILRQKYEIIVPKPQSSKVTRSTKSKASPDDANPRPRKGKKS